MSDAPSPVVTVACAKCHAPVAEFAAHAAGEGEGLLRDRPRLWRLGWFGACERPMPVATATAILDAIRAGELAALRRGEPDLFGFVCRTCEIPYCFACWTVHPPRFDDGFYDCTRATCPAGHEQTVDD